MKDQITAQSYELYTDNGQWLGQVVLTSNGMYASVTDWGNYSFMWNSIGNQTFKQFLLGIDETYFGTKMYTGMAYLTATKKVEAACQRYASHILPALKKVLKEELEKDSGCALRNNGCPFFDE
jgi:hypothetical protein